jgi:pyruvate/2-oxoglutarate dehydrogenase complex dihydrolipoamide acyltransferase (E2) component
MTNLKTLLMPEAMAGGTLARWLKRVGDPVTAGEVVAEVESDKAAMQLESPCNGVVAAIEVPEGTTAVPADAQLAIFRE